LKTLRLADRHIDTTGRARRAGGAHLKSLLTHQLVVLAIAAGRPDLRMRRGLSYVEIDGHRPKRLIIEITGD
jgi:thiamine phosphate synthase YjbQ (UPF0047 family)